MASNALSVDHILAARILDASRGDEHACFDLGVAYSTGANGVDLDLIEAHKWFNIAAMSGSSEGQYCRAEIAREMSRAEITEAQRLARAWLKECQSAVRH